MTKETIVGTVLLHVHEISLLALKVLHDQVSVTLYVPSRDTICDLGSASELANYGEYSGAPSEQQTYDYAKTILSLMCKEFHPEGRLNHVSDKLK